MSAPRLEQRGEASAVWRAIAGELLEVCRERQDEGAVPCLVLTGGSGGEGVLNELSVHPALDRVDWRRVRFLWGDERWVPQGHEDRNDALADSSLFGAVTVDTALVHRVPASDHGLSLDEAAAAYADIVSGIERIDLALSGVGPDGHVASIFPGRVELSLPECAPEAIAVRESPKPPAERISLTLEALNRADRSWLLAAGQGKAEAVRLILAPETPPLPAARLHGRGETVLWADDAAVG